MTETDKNAVAVRPDVPVDLTGFAPRNIDEAYRLGEGFVKAGFFPALKSGAQAIVAMQISRDTGVPFTSVASNIMFVNGRVSLYGDALLGVAMQSGLMEDFEETVDGEGEEAVATCRIQRKGIKTAIIRKFSVADAKAAKLWGKAGPWQSYPKRMLQMRARAWALRDGGLTSGISAAEEVLDIKAAPTETPPQLAEPAKQKWDAIVTGGKIHDEIMAEKAAVKPAEVEKVETPTVEAPSEPPQGEPGETEPGKGDWDSKGELPF